MLQRKKSTPDFLDCTMDPSLRIAPKNQMKVDFKLKEIELFI